MTIIDTDDVRAGLESIVPVPAGEYEHAFYCQEMRRVLDELVKYYRCRFSEAVEEIEASGLVSDAYVLRSEEKRNTVVNVPLLREGLPDLFAELVHISTTDAAKLLSNRFLYDETRKRIGDRIQKYEVVNAKDLEARLPEPELSEYMTVRSVPKGYVVYEVKS